MAEKRTFTDAAALVFLHHATDIAARERLLKTQKLIRPPRSFSGHKANNQDGRKN